MGVTIEVLRKEISEAQKKLGESAPRAAYLGTLFGEFQNRASAIWKMPDGEFEKWLVNLLQLAGIEAYDEEVEELPTVKKLRPIRDIVAEVQIAHPVVQAERRELAEQIREAAHIRRALRKSMRSPRTGDPQGKKYFGGGCSHGTAPGCGHYSDLSGFAGKGGSRKPQPKKQEKKRGKRQRD